MPNGVNKMHMLGVSFLAAIGFTMSIFISNLAFRTSIYGVEAKMGIFAASVLASFVGYYILSKASDKKS
jgi:Na+:H+ antiporter, NhaA family